MKTSLSVIFPSTLIGQAFHKALWPEKDSARFPVCHKTGGLLTGCIPHQHRRAQEVYQLNLGLCSLCQPQHQPPPKVPF